MNVSDFDLKLKNRLTYEVFFYSITFTAYSVFYNKNQLVNSLLFVVLFGTLFIRFHIIFSDSELSESKIGKLSGTAGMLIVITLISYSSIIFLQSHIKHQLHILLFVLSMSTLFLIIINKKLFRHDEQRKNVFEETIEEESGIISSISKLCLKCDSYIQNSPGKIDISKKDVDDLLEYPDMRDVPTKDYHDLLEELEIKFAIHAISCVVIHVHFSIIVMVLILLLASYFTTISLITIFNLIIISSVTWYLYNTLHIRFGLRINPQRQIRQIPAEIYLCTALTYGLINIRSLPLISILSDVLIIFLSFAYLFSYEFTLLSLYKLNNISNLVDEDEEEIIIDYAELIYGD